MQINTHTLKPDLAGEVLRDFCFKDKYKYLLSSYFTEVTNKSVLLDIISKYNMLLPEDWRGHDYRIRYFVSPVWGSTIEVIFFHDGDTTLIINDCGRVLFNGDAKKDYGWRVVDIHPDEYKD